MPDFSGARPIARGANSLGAAALGERLRFSSPVMLECGVPSTPRSLSRC